MGPSPPGHALIGLPARAALQFIFSPHANFCPSHRLRMSLSHANPAAAHRPTAILLHPSIAAVPLPPPHSVPAIRTTADLHPGIASADPPFYDHSTPPRLWSPHRFLRHFLCHPPELRLIPRVVCNPWPIRHHPRSYGAFTLFDHSRQVTSSATFCATHQNYG